MGDEATKMLCRALMLPVGRQVGIGKVLEAAGLSDPLQRLRQCYLCEVPDVARRRHRREPV